MDPLPQHSFVADLLCQDFPRPVCVRWDIHCLFNYKSLKCISFISFDNCLLLIVLSKVEVKKPNLSASQFSLHAWTRTCLMTSNSLVLILITATCKSIERWHHKETTSPRNFPKYLLSKHPLQCQCHSEQSLRLHHENCGVEEWTKSGSYECSEEQELRMKLIPMT